MEQLIERIVASHWLVNPANLSAASAVMSTSERPSLSDTPPERSLDPASDHASVMATFTLGPCSSLRTPHRPQSAGYSDDVNGDNHAYRIRPARQGQGTQRCL